MRSSKWSQLSMSHFSTRCCSYLIQRPPWSKCCTSMPIFLIRRLLLTGQLQNHLRSSCFGRCWMFTFWKSGVCSIWEVSPQRMHKKHLSLLILPSWETTLTVSSLVCLQLADKACIWDYRRWVKVFLKKFSKLLSVTPALIFLIDGTSMTWL